MREKFLFKSEVFFNVGKKNISRKITEEAALMLMRPQTCVSCAYTAILMCTSTCYLLVEKLKSTRLEESCI